MTEVIKIDHTNIKRFEEEFNIKSPKKSQNHSLEVYQNRSIDIETFKKRNPNIEVIEVVSIDV